MKQHLIISERGKDFKGNNLNENNVGGGQLVIWKGKLYITGNRRHFAVELYDFWKAFVMTVDARNIYLVKLKK